VYKVVFSKQSAKFIKKIPQSYQVKIKNHILKLQQDPFATDIKKLSPPYKATHRSRLGPYRLFLEITVESKEIIIVEINRRTTQTYK
jgi:mRNA-degrading endonuclease RelE of RelBE toxin-antitoxin system